MLFLKGGIALSQQLKLFEQYIEKLKEMVGEERTTFIIKNSLFMVICGSNDITNTYFALPSVQYQYDVASFTTLLADNARSFAQKLYEYGARRIQVFGAPPVGCVPSQRTLAGGPTRNCVVRFNDATKLYNAKLAANLDSLSRTLGEKTIIYVDIYDSLFDIILDPQQYGFKVVDRGCCGTGLIEVTVLCNNFAADTIAAVKLPPNLIVPALIAFGDSIVDTGMNNNVKTVVKCDFHPYGIDFQGGVATGRFCDGRVPADLLAEELGIKSIVPAYLDPNLKSKDLLTGVSFASGGSGYDPITPKLVAVISLEDQLNYFEEYIEKVKNIVGEEKKDFILANSLFLLVAGSDDIANTYYTIHARPEYDIDSYTTLMSDSASEFVTKLYGYGVRRVAVFGAPPIGCVPSQRTLGGGIMRDCAETYNEAAKLFNSKLSPKLDLLRKTLPGIRPIYINIYDPLFDIIKNPANYGNTQRFISFKL
ncbi:GDSL lipase/esterase [Arabidopsis thaliana x Arabidopsis arenosa]|uniref:GDSL lipase/esterase n=1 Tax=Arabidopsis thaliana x Arabidopsis arenosa TaxID=1240361 RepID=A0A8T2BNT0_9BRAS|nr:GDSL lipase/esterase [Arabidopsis thaliana x Arabidopsis arenosa]